MSDRMAPAARTFTFESRNPDADRTRFFGELRDFAASCGWLQAITNEVELILEEWWTNLTHYALASSGDPLVIVQIRSEGDRAFIEVHDNGIPFDPTARPDPDLTLPMEERSVGGLGIYMMKKITRSMRSERRGNFNILRLEKDLAHPSLGAR
jgi:serine/threonine-protein kinase RsbW